MRLNAVLALMPDRPHGASLSRNAITGIANAATTTIQEATIEAMKSAGFIGAAERPRPELFGLEPFWVVPRSFNSAGRAAVSRQEHLVKICV
jgi:hypothetical protein